MRWTSRLKRRGGRGSIEASRARQFRLLNRARLRVDLKETAEISFAWLLEHPLRCLSVDEEAFYAGAVP